MTLFQRMLQEETIKIKLLHHLTGAVPFSDVNTLRLKLTSAASVLFSHAELTIEISTTSTAKSLTPKTTVFVYVVRQYPICMVPVSSPMSCFYPPLPRHLVVRIVVTTDAEAKELAGSALDLEPLDLQGTLK